MHMRHWYGLVLVFTIFVPSIRCVDWSTLTKDELGRLSPEEFLNITADELGSIPAEAMNGLQEDQFDSIPFASCSGFTADQISNLSIARCTAFNESHIEYITPEAFGSFDYRCYDSWKQNAWQAMSAAQVSHFSNQSCSELFTNKVWWLKPNAISGFTTSCVAQFNLCHSFNSTLFSLLLPDAISGLTSLCFDGASLDVFELATAAQMAALPPLVCSRIDSSHVIHIHYDAVSGLTPECVAYLGTDACRATNGTWMSHLALDSVSALTGRCVVGIPSATDLKLLNAAFFGALNPLSCANWTGAQSMYFTAQAASGVTPQCLGNFTTSQLDGACNGLSADFISGLSAASFNGLTADCIRTILPPSFTGVKSDQLSGINVKLCRSFSFDQVSALPSDAAPGMKALCLQEFTSSEHGACAGLQGSFVARMQPETFTGLTYECVRFMYSTSFALISDKQVANIPVITFRALSNTQIEVLSNDAIQGATLEQLKHVSNSGFDGFTMAHLVIIIRKYGLELVPAWTVEQTRTTEVYEISHFKELVTKHNFAKLVSWDDVSGNVSRATWVVTALLKDEPSPRIDADTIRALAPSAVAGLRADHIQMIAGRDFAAFTPSQGAWFTDDQVSVLTTVQLKNMPAKTFGAMNFMVISSLQPNLISELSIDQIQALPVLNIEYMTCDQLKNFTHEQTSNFVLEQQVAYESSNKQCKNGELLIPLAESDDSEAPTIVLMTMAGVIVVSFIIALIVWSVQRRKQQAEGHMDEEDRVPLMIN